MKIKDVMHKGVTCVEPRTPVTEIAKRMRDATSLAEQWRMAETLAN